VWPDCSGGATIVRQQPSQVPANTPNTQIWEAYPGTGYTGQAAQIGGSRAASVGESAAFSDALRLRPYL
jgi:hypothetical protein